MPGSALVEVYLRHPMWSVKRSSCFISYHWRCMRRQIRIIRLCEENDFVALVEMMRIWDSAIVGACRRTGIDVYSGSPSPSSANRGEYTGVVISVHMSRGAYKGHCIYDYRVARCGCLNYSCLCYGIPILRSRCGFRTSPLGDLR